MALGKPTPILRIFDEAKAREFMKIATTGLGASFGPAWNSQAFIDINDPRRVAAELVNACASQFRLSIETAAKAGDVVAAGNLAEVAGPAPEECPAEWDYDCEVCCRPMVIAFEIDGDVIRALYVVRNPDKLRHLARPRHESRRE